MLVKLLLSSAISLRPHIPQGSRITPKDKKIIERAEHAQNTNMETKRGNYPGNTQQYLEPLTFYPQFLNADASGCTAAE